MRAAGFALVLLLACAHRPPPATASEQAPTTEQHQTARDHGAHQHGHHPPAMQHRFEDAEKWAAVFEDPARDEWQKPDQVIAALKLPADARVADIGSGTGYFAVRLARAAPRGRVYGVDIEPSMQKYLQDRAAKEGLKNLVAVLGAPDDPKIPEPVDLVLVVDTYHHIEARPAYFQRLASKLKPNGRIAIIDFTKEAMRGPPVQHRFDADQITAEMAEAGYRLTESHSLPEQHFLIYARRP